MAALLGFGIICYQLLPVSALPNVISDHLGHGAASRARAPTRWPTPWRRRSRNEFTAIPGLSSDDLDQRARHDHDQLAVRVDQRHRWRGAVTCRRRSTQRAACCRRTCRPRRPIARPIPADRPVLIYAVHSGAMPRTRSTSMPTTMLAERSRRSAGLGRRSSPGSNTPAVHVQVEPGGSRRARDQPRPDRHRADPDATTDAAKGNLEGKAQNSRSTPTTSCSTPSNSAM